MLITLRHLRSRGDMRPNSGSLTERRAIEEGAEARYLLQRCFPSPPLPRPRLVPLRVRRGHEVPQRIARVVELALGRDLRAAVARRIVIPAQRLDQACAAGVDEQPRRAG